MHINRIVEEVLSPDAVELLNVLAVHAVATANTQAESLCYLPVEEDAWNATMHLMREIFEAEILISGEDEWLSFRLLQSYGVKDGQVAYQFTPTFAKALST